MKQLLHPVLNLFMLRILKQIPVELSFLAPLLLLCELLSHEQKLLATVSHHKCISCHEVFEFIRLKARHFVEHRAFQMHNLIVRQHKDVILTLVVAHRKCHLVVVIFTEIWIQLHIIKEVMHPSHVPLVAEVQSIFLYLACYFWPCGRLFGYHYSSVISSKYECVDMLEKFHCLKILIATELVWNPLSISLSVIEIKH